MDMFSSEFASAWSEDRALRTGMHGNELMVDGKVLIRIVNPRLGIKQHVSLNVMRMAQHAGRLLVAQTITAQKSQLLQEIVLCFK